MYQRRKVAKMTHTAFDAFDTTTFLANPGLGRRIIQLAAKDAFFSQGDPADSIFYLQKGRAKVTVVSASGKEATITLLAAGDFVGEEALATVAGLRLATATAITAVPQCILKYLKRQIQSGKKRCPLLLLLPE